MGMLGEEPGVNAANEAAQPDHPRASSPRPVPCNDTTGHILPITSEEQAQDARSIAAFVERMLAMPDEDPPGSGLETCPSVGEMARSGDLATTWSVIAKTPGNASRPVPKDSISPPPSVAPAKNRLGESGHPRLLCATK